MSIYFTIGCQVLKSNCQHFVLQKNSYKQSLWYKQAWIQESVPNQDRYSDAQDTDQDQDFQISVSRRLDTKTQVSRTLSIHQSAKCTVCITVQTVPVHTDVHSQPMLHCITIIWYCVLFFYQPLTTRLLMYLYQYQKHQFPWLINSHTTNIISAVFFSVETLITNLSSYNSTTVS